MIPNIYNIITMEYSCCVPGCKSNYKNDESSVTVFKFPSIGKLRQKLLQNIPRKLDKITQSTRLCIKYFEDKDMHSLNIHTNPDGTTYTVSGVVLIKLFYCTYMHYDYYEYNKYVKYGIILFVNYFS